MKAGIGQVGMDGPIGADGLFIISVQRDQEGISGGAVIIGICWDEVEGRVEGWVSGQRMRT
jgi:hypothetical protein